MTERHNTSKSEDAPFWQRLWRNTDLRVKLAIGLGVLLLLMVSVAALSLLAIQLSESKIQHVRARHMPAIMKVKRMRECVSRMMAEQRNYLLTGRMENRQAFYETCKKLTKTMDNIKPQLSPKAQRQLPLLRKRLDTWEGVTENLFQLRDDSLRDNPAKQYCANNARPLFIKQTQHTNEILKRLAGNTEKQTSDPAKETFIKRTALHLYKESLETIINRLDHYVDNGAPSPKYALQSDLIQHDRYWETVKTVFPAGTNSVQRLESGRSDFLTTVENTVKMVDKKGTSLSLKNFAQQALPLGNKIREQLADIASAQDEATTTSLARTSRRLSFLRYLVFLALGIGIGLTIILAFMYTVSVVRPVQRLTNTAETVADGDLNTRTDLTGNDEIGRLGSAFNTMASKLQNMIQRLETHKDNLEELVAQRTHQLTRATQVLKDDVRKRARIEDELRSNERHLRTTLKSIADAVIATDQSGEVEWMNPIAEKLTGWTEQDAKGEHISEIFQVRNTETAEGMSHPVNDVLENDETVQLGASTVLISRDGSTYYIDDSAAPIHDENARTTGAVIVFRDVTEKQKQKRELRKMQKLESLGTLAGGIAHDFNNMLQGVFGHIELALNKLPENSQPYQYLQSSHDALQNARNLTSQLLTFARGGQPVVETMDLNQRVRDTVEFHLRGSEIQPEFDLPDDLWAVTGDSDQVGQVISNLTINAKEEMADGGQLHVSAKNVTDPDTKSLAPLEGRYVKLQIRDEGSGIPQNTLDRIFDPYFTSKPEGSGLGLSIAYSIIQNHDGHVEVESTSESGTTFSVYMPAETREEQSEPEVSDEDNVPVPEETVHVLVMDDDESVRELAKEMLKHCGHSVETVKDGEEAVQQYARAAEKDYPFDVVIMDLTVPGGMGGTEAVRELLEIDPDARVIVSSGYSSDPVLANYEDYGFVGRLKKPFNMDQLQQEIGRAL